jgi:hypothetical protein
MSERLPTALLGLAIVLAFWALCCYVDACDCADRLLSLREWLTGDW